MGIYQSFVEKRNIKVFFSISFQTFLTKPKEALREDQIDENFPWFFIEDRVPLYFLFHKDNIKEPGQISKDPF